MQTAVTWERDPEHPWSGSVEGRLAERCEGLTQPETSVVILVFAFPDSWSAKQLMQRREYFDIRSCEDWDVFFPGYYRYGSMGDPQQVDLADYWGFSPRAFDRFRRDLEVRTERRWRFRGESELIAMNAFLTADGPAVDFTSVVSGPLTERDRGITTRTLAEAIERLGQQFDDESDDSDYGLGEVFAPPTTDGPKREPAIGKIGIGAAGGVASALVRHALGLP